MFDVVNTGENIEFFFISTTKIYKNFLKNNDNNSLIEIVLHVSVYREMNEVKIAFIYIKNCYLCLLQ